MEAKNTDLLPSGKTKMSEMLRRAADVQNFGEKIKALSANSNSPVTAGLNPSNTGNGRPSISGGKRGSTSSSVTNTAFGSSGKS